MTLSPQRGEERAVPSAMLGDRPGMQAEKAAGRGRERALTLQLPDSRGLSSARLGRSLLTSPLPSAYLPSFSIFLARLVSFFHLPSPTPPSLLSHFVLKNVIVRFYMDKTLLVLIFNVIFFHSCSCYSILLEKKKLSK